MPCTASLHLTGLARFARGATLTFTIEGRDVSRDAFNALAAQAGTTALAVVGGDALQCGSALASAFKFTRYPAPCGERLLVDATVVFATARQVIARCAVYVVTGVERRLAATAHATLVAP